MEEYLDAWLIVIILFLAGLLSAIIVYYTVRVIDIILVRNDSIQETQSWIRFFAWPLALLTWAAVDYLIYPYIKSSF
jgi:hypothetical protein